jgi:uroporphyrin-III C-methyltransferase/precorrin-2 dehydrogenase/sirohydrochlorin ferrochelatase
MQHLPIFADLRDRDCLVVGGGSVAERRANLLLQAGARVTVRAPEITEGLRSLAEAGELRLDRRVFSAADLEAYWLVIAATDRPDVNTAVARAADRAQRFCNVVDDPENCSFIMPAIVDRDPVTVAVSSGGYSPVLARWTKGLIESILPARLGALATLAREWRQRVKETLPDIGERRRFWQTVIGGRVAEHVYAGRAEDSRNALADALAQWRSGSHAEAAGEAYLVGAGPGSKDLLTLRGRQLLATADVVLYDRLVNTEILEYARRDAELISVGKSPGCHSITQAQINEMLIGLVAAGRKVCRLKGGDPMIFGRAGEELEALANAGLRFQVVPGVSALEGCAAYAGIPLTLRGVSRSILIATGHTRRPGRADLSGAMAHQTIAIYMGVAHYGDVAVSLIETGLSPGTPVAVIENGTTDRQRVIRTTLEHLPAARERYSIEAPALLLIGETTAQAEKFAWFAPGRLEIHDADVQSTLARVS